MKSFIMANNITNPAQGAILLQMYIACINVYNASLNNQWRILGKLIQ
jgi:hypothetical protein